MRAVPTLCPASNTSLPVAGVKGITKRFQAVCALSSVTIDFHAGQVHVLMGENGAGKSTLIGILAGVHRPDEGHVEMDGRAIAPASPRDAMALGITAVFQEPALVPQLTVAENLTLVREHLRWGLLCRSKNRAEALQALQRTGATIDPDDLVRALHRA